MLPAFRELIQSAHRPAVATGETRLWGRSGVRLSAGDVLYPRALVGWAGLATGFEGGSTKGTERLHPVSGIWVLLDGHRGGSDSYRSPSCLSRLGHRGL